MKPALVLAAAALATAATASAAPQTGRYKPVLTDNIGREAILNVWFPEAADLVPAPIPASDVAAEFDTLCLKTGFDSAALAAASSASRFGLKLVPLHVAGTKSGAAFELPGYHGASAVARIWAGDGKSFGKLPFIVIDSGVEITGPAGSGTIKTFLPQCNLDVGSTSLGDWSGLLAAVTAVVGRQPDHAKNSKSWGQATWEGPDRVVGLRVDGLNKPSQQVHLGIVRLPPAGAK